jgi:hypothetical protein
MTFVQKYFEHLLCIRKYTKLWIYNDKADMFSTSWSDGSLAKHRLTKQMWFQTFVNIKKKGKLLLE